MVENSNVSKYIWDWRNSSPNMQKIVSLRRRRALIQFCIMFLIASVLVFIFNHVFIGIFIYSIAALIFIGGFFVPLIFNAIESIGRKFAKGIGMGLTWLLLVPFFYCTFVPARLILKLFRKDPMKRFWEKGKDSYWIDRTQISDPDYYRRQY